jgi:hypothetical protein
VSEQENASGAQVPCISLLADVVAAWDSFSEALDCSDAEEEMTERQRSKYSRLSDAIARLRTPANAGHQILSEAK